MQLFKRVLLSFFPDDMMTNNVNPASMFVSFISSKDFFSIINRKIIENYKLNLFDITIDPFELKIGFGENKGINKKDLDLYYGYCGAANINGYRFMNPSNLGNTISITVGLFTYNLFNKYNETYFINFMFSVYLLNFIFLSRIKVFPYKDKGKNYNRFIELFFKFYETVFYQSRTKFNKKDFLELKKNLVGEFDIFFMLFNHFQKFNNLYFSYGYESDEDFYKWIFYDELKDSSTSFFIKEFIDKRGDSIYKAEFSLLDSKILQYILPSDILLKYILIDMDINNLFSCVIPKVYDKKELEKILGKFHTGKGDLNELYTYLTDYKNFKKGYFDGIQKYLVNIFRDNDKTKDPFEEDLDDMMSDIGSEPENIKNLKIPERIKKESKIMEKFLNFFLTLIGGFWIARGDSFNIRLFKKDLINQILSNSERGDNKANTIHFYGSMLYNYGKNVFYYKNISDNVRAGKQKFFLPYKNTNKNIYSNMHIVKMFEESFIATLFQRTDNKDIRLYASNKKILDIFKSTFGKEISNLAKKEKKELIQYLYGELFKGILTDGLNTKEILKYITDSDIMHIKDNMYTLDFWIYIEVLNNLKNIGLKKDYSDANIFGIISCMIETLPGFLLYITYLKQTKKSLKIEILYQIYCIDVLNITKDYSDKLIKMIKSIETKFCNILNLWIELDDNKDFFKIGLTNWKDFSKGKTELYKSISGEDVLRFKGFIKNITYYNKRFLIPK